MPHPATISRTSKGEDPDAPGWVALAEVKGYSNGGKTDALQQLARFSRRYSLRTGASILSSVNPPSASSGPSRSIVVPNVS
jgi:hypothetical protein